MRLIINPTTGATDADESEEMEDFVQTHVFISSTMDVKSRVRNWWKKLRLKTACQHLGLLITLACYTVAGAWVSSRIFNFLFLISTNPWKVNIIQFSAKLWTFRLLLWTFPGIESSRHFLIAIL